MPKRTRVFFVRRKKKDWGVCREQKIFLSFSFGTGRKLLRKIFWHGLCLIRCMKRNEHHFVRFMTACCDGKEFICKIHFIRDYLRR